MMSKIKKIIKKISPPFIVNVYRKYAVARFEGKEAKIIAEAPYLHEIALKKVKDKNGPINVIFFALMESVWKYDYLYRMMEKDARFNATVLVCPIVNYGKENMLRNLHRCYDFYKKKGYKVILSYDEAKDRYLDVKKELSPDLIFYTNPYRGLIHPKYYIDNFKDILTAYVPYYYSECSDYGIWDNTLVHNAVWRKYIENNFVHKNHLKKTKNNGYNDVVTGYPGIDGFIDKNYIPQNNPWKTCKKRIVWAPHHTINSYNICKYSTFLEYCDFMLSIADKYKESIEIAFRPHPLLINRLYIDWGKSRADEYYAKWEEMENTFFNEGEYTDLFLTCDAIIHDCGSFLMESLFIDKPLLHLDNNIPDKEQFNDLAIEGLSHYYRAKSKEDIESFIRMLLENKDPKETERKIFVKEKLLPPNGKLASENIFDDLIKSLDLDKKNGRIKE